jgi:hypothetical protein
MILKSHSQQGKKMLEKYIRKCNEENLKIYMDAYELVLAKPGIPERLEVAKQIASMTSSNETKDVNVSFDALDTISPFDYSATLSKISETLDKLFILSKETTELAKGTIENAQRLMDLNMTEDVKKSSKRPSRPKKLKK